MAFELDVYRYAFIRSLQREGVAACAKHYPGHGDTLLDSHVDLPLLPHSLTRLMEIEIPPFAKAVDADVAAVMVAHIDVPCFSGRSEPASKPASMCKDAIDYLRDALLFEGVIISDCMELGAIVKGYSIEEAATQAVLAGVDMVLIAHTMSRQTAVVNTLVQGVLTGRIPYRRVIDAASRISTLKQTYVRSPFKDVAEEKFWESEIQGIGCKEHHDVVANVIHQSAVVSGRGVVRERKFRLNLW
jgi:beta-N-acetylhexosaminidase